MNWTKVDYAKYLAKQAAHSLAKLPSTKSKQNSVTPLVRQASGKQAGRRGVAGSRRVKSRSVLRIGLVACYNRGPQKDEHDNLPASFKQLSDALANWFGCDDSEIEWHYAQIRWPKAGTIVIVERV